MMHLYHFDANYNYNRNQNQNKNKNNISIYNPVGGLLPQAVEAVERSIFLFLSATEPQLLR